MITLDTTGPSLFKRGYRLERRRAAERKHGCGFSDADKLVQRQARLSILFVDQARCVLKQR